MFENAQAMVAAGFDVKGSRSWDTRNGVGFTYTLLFERRPVAVVSNDGDGGMTWPDWLASRRPRTVEKARAALVALVERAKPIEAGGGSPEIPATLETLLSEFGDYADLRRLCDRRLVFRSDGAMRALSSPYTAEAAAFVRAKWKDAVIVNEEIGATGRTGGVA